MVVPIQAIHRSTLAWGEDAHEFRPDRWRRTSKSLSGLPGVARSPATASKQGGNDPLPLSEHRNKEEPDVNEHEREGATPGKVVDLTYAASLPLIGEEKSRPVFTFGGGPRSCVGRLFSLTEQKIMLGTLLKRFRIELTPSQGPFSQTIRGFVARPSPSPEILLFVR
jgi:cytochrome P450